MLYTHYQNKAWASLYLSLFNFTFVNLQSVKQIPRGKQQLNFTQQGRWFKSLFFSINFHEICKTLIVLRPLILSQI